MIKGRVQTTVKGQENVDRLRKELARHPKAYVTIGVHEGAGEYETGVSVAEVALWNEFGTKTIPSRPFLSTVLDEKASLINSWREEALNKIATGVWSVEKALEAIGFRVKTLIENKIKSDMPPPNAPSTVAEKIRSGVPPRTLVNSRLLLRSISYRVHLA